MKKIFVLPIIIISFLFLSGCSLSGTQTDQATQRYTLSKSIWKSVDGGKTWEAKDKATKKPTVSDLDVLQIAINRQDSSIIYAGLKNGGMIKSADGGDNWEMTNFISDKVYGLEIDPNDGQILYVSGVWQGRGKIFKTDDGGESWTEIYTKAANGPLVISLTLDQKNTNVLYATTNDNDVIKSVDGGKSWQNIFKGNSPVLKVAIDRSNSDLIYILDQSGSVSVSLDGGKKFVDISSRIEDSSFFSRSFTMVETDPTHSERVYLVGGSGIMRSDDAGKNWKKVVALDNPENFPIVTLAINPYNSDEIIYGAAQASFASVDGGTNWTPFQFAVNKKTSVIQYDPQNPSTVYLGFSK